MIFFGDVHGKYKEYFKLINALGVQSSIQLGDLGIGFPNCKWPEKWDLKHKFFVGNHDNRKKCLKYPNCLGNHGYLEQQNIYFISGAWSIDKKVRIPGISWWDDEELSYSELYQACINIKETKPRIILSHDCPNIVRDTLFCFKETFATRTGNALQWIFEEYQPEIWIFAHYHRSAQALINGTHFICLQELESCEIKDVPDFE